MNTLRGFLSPWALAGVAVWLVVMVIAYQWAIPIYANIEGPGLCAAGLPNCAPGSITVTQPATTIFAIVVASITTAAMVGLVVLVRRLASRPKQPES